MSEEKSLNFLEEIIEEDLRSGKYDSIKTRFPPEPNGYLHIGHAKSIALNFGLARKYGGKTNLRFDDTNPATEETEYVESIREDIRWLGFQWAEEWYASDYFEQLYGFALDLIQKGLAYVEDSSSEEIAVLKGTPTEAGRESPSRFRAVSENLRLFREMREGRFTDGEKVLRAKIDMSSPNMHMRDPIIYRIKHAPHHRTGNSWCIYPMYDFAHGQSDSIEGITHSICTLEFVPHRPLYDWFIEKLVLFSSRQYEFARLNLSYTVLSKRKLIQLVQEEKVSGWDDPRMPTICGLRRRGYTAESIRHFCDLVGVQKRETVIDASLLEFCVREHLNQITPRIMAVLDPVRLVLTNFPEDQVEWMEMEINPQDPSLGNRPLPLTREIWIEREDFMEVPVKKFFRLGPGLRVRLKGAYIIHCSHYEKDEQGRVRVIYAQYLPGSRSGEDISGLKVKGTIHWVSIARGLPIEVRLYDRLFRVEYPAAEPGDLMELINPGSLKITREAFIEPYLEQSGNQKAFQFLRKGYFCLDPDSRPEHPVFNRTVTLKDTWAREAAKSE